MIATAIISAYDSRINNYNIILVTSWYIRSKRNVSTPDLSPHQCWYEYYNLTSQIGRSSAQGQVVKVGWEVMNLKLYVIEK